MDDLKEVLNRVKKKLRVTKIVATRSVKGRNGDSFAGFSAGWESVQDDLGGPGSSLESSGITESEQSAQGMTLQEAKVAHYILAMTADIAATQSAMAGGSLAPEVATGLIRQYKIEYAKLIRNVVGGSKDDSHGEE